MHRPLRQLGSAVARGATCLVALSFASAGGCADRGRGDPILTYAQYRRIEHRTPYVLEFGTSEGRLVYFGAAHFLDPNDPQGLEIERRWARLNPTLALNEGGDPPVEKSREEAIGRHGEPGLVRWLAARDRVPVRSLDPTRQEEVTNLLSRFSREQVKVFFVLLQVQHDRVRAPEFRAPSPEAVVERTLLHLARIEGLEGAPSDVPEFEAACTKLVPDLQDWRMVPREWFDPALDVPLAFTNRVARASSQFRDRFMVDLLGREVRAGNRVFAAVGASHVVMQKAALESRLGSATKQEAYGINREETPPAPVPSP